MPVEGVEQAANSQPGKEKPTSSAAAGLGNVGEDADAGLDASGVCLSKCKSG